MGARHPPAQPLFSLASERQQAGNFSGQAGSHVTLSGQTSNIEPSRFVAIDWLGNGVCGHGNPCLGNFLGGSGGTGMTDYKSGQESIRTKSNDTRLHSYR